MGDTTDYRTQVYDNVPTCNRKVSLFVSFVHEMSLFVSVSERVCATMSTCTFIIFV